MFIRFVFVFLLKSSAVRRSFSGDTIPSDRLAWAGKGATLLIHEASMGDDALETAMASRKKNTVHSAKL